MTTLGYVVMALLTLGACAFVLPVVIRGRGRIHTTPSHDQAVRALYRQRMDEVEEENADPQVLAQIKDELGAVLLTEAVSADGSVKHQAQSSSGRWAWLWLCFVPAMAIALHQWIADPGVLLVKGAETLMSLDGQAQRSEVEQWQQRLSARVVAEDGDHRSWYLLGHAELKLGNFAAAAQAFASTHALVKEDVQVQVYWLQARYLAADGILDEVSRKLADDLLSKNPNLPVVLEMLAIDAYRAGRAADTVQLLNRAISGSQDPLQQASFAVAIRQVRSTMPDPLPGVRVQASADGNPPQGATLFVIARPVGGGMPYAVVKRPAALLPTVVDLDDLVSMSPERPLTSAEEFEVVVRISRTGSAVPAADDWQWISGVQSLARADESRGGTLIDLKAELTPPAPG